MVKNKRLVVVAMLLCCLGIAHAERYLPQWQRKLEHREKLQRQQHNRRLWEQDEAVQEHRRALKEHQQKQKQGVTTSTAAVEVEVDPASTNGDTVVRHRLQAFPGWTEQDYDDGEQSGNIFMPALDENIAEKMDATEEYKDEAFLMDGRVGSSSPENIELEIKSETKEEEDDPAFSAHAATVAKEETTTLQQEELEDNTGPNLIFGGTNAVQGAFPYYVDLFADNSNICGGSLIHPKVVLSAAHCNFDASGTTAVPQLVGTQVRVGAFNDDGTDDGSQLATVMQQIIHPEYAESETGATNFFLLNDVMLLVLDREVEISQTPELRLSRNTANIEPGTNMVIVGLGATAVGPTVPATTLQQSTIVAVSDNFCDQLFPESSVCAGVAPNGATRSDTNTCAGDSGSPMLYADGDVHYQVGIVSYGPSACDGTGLTRFAQIPGYETAGFNWIYEQVCDELGLIDATFCGGQECNCDEDCNLGYDCMCVSDIGKKSSSSSSSSSVSSLSSRDPDFDTGTRRQRRQQRLESFLEDSGNEVRPDENTPDELDQDYKQERPPQQRHTKEETFQSFHKSHLDDRQNRRRAKSSSGSSSSSGKSGKSCKSQKSCKSSGGPICIDNGKLSGDEEENIQELNVMFGDLRRQRE